MTGAVACYRQALEAFERVGDTPEVARVHCEMGWAAAAADALSKRTGVVVDHRRSAAALTIAW